MSEKEKKVCDEIFGNELVTNDDNLEETEQDDDVGESSFWGYIINV